MDLVGKVGVFIPVGDGVWEELYGNKICTVIELEEYEYSNSYGVLVEFEDGKKITIADDEFTVINN